MSKFTFFTILFSLIVILIVGQLVLRDAIFPSEFKTQIISDEQAAPLEVQSVSSESVPATPEEPAIDQPIASTPVVEPDASPAIPAPVQTPATNPTALYLDGAVVTRAGFTDGKAVPFSGKIFDLFDLGTYQPLSVNSYQANEGGAPAGLFTEIKFEDEIQAQGFYGLLLNKTKVYVDIVTNETNAYGDRSFFINHTKKPNEVFLAVRMRNMVYSFAYTKNLHPRVKSLISFLYTAILDQH